MLLLQPVENVKFIKPSNVLNVRLVIMSKRRRMLRMREAILTVDALEIFANAIMVTLVKAQSVPKIINTDASLV